MGRIIPKVTELPHAQRRVAETIHFISEEFAFFILQDVTKFFPNFVIVSYFPFAPRHGKSVCDRHFGKVSLWTGQFENSNTMSCVKDVMDAILNGQRDAKKTRKLERKNEIEVYAIENKLVEPTGPQNKIIFPSLQSTHAISFHRNTKKLSTMFIQILIRKLGLKF